MMFDGDSRCGSADDLLTRRHRMCEAQFKLAMLPAHDELIDAEQQLDAADDLTPWEVATWRQLFRSQYRRAVGVEMDQRDRLVEELREVAETGSRTVAGVIAAINAVQRNQLSSGLSAEGLGELVSS